MRQAAWALLASLTLALASAAHGARGLLVPAQVTSFEVQTTQTNGGMVPSLTSHSLGIEHDCRLRKFFVRTICAETPEAPSDTVETGGDLVDANPNDGDGCRTEYDLANVCQRNVAGTVSDTIIVYHKVGNVKLPAVTYGKAVTATEAAAMSIAFAAVLPSPVGVAPFSPVLGLSALGGTVPVVWDFDCNGDGSFETQHGHSGKQFNAAPCGSYTEGLYAIGARVCDEAGVGCGTAQVQIVVEAPAPEPACRDGLDNDGDGLRDYPSDPGCASPDSPSESPECSDGLDNDADGAVDGVDADCSSPFDQSEHGSVQAVCSNTLDDDGDTLVDAADPGCPDAAGTKENPRCNNGTDDDDDEQVDYPSDSGCYGPSDDDETGPVGTGAIFEERFDAANVGTIASHFGSCCQGTTGISVITGAGNTRPGAADGQAIRMAANGSSYLYKRLPQDYGRIYMRVWLRYGAGSSAGHPGIVVGGYSPPTVFPQGDSGWKGYRDPAFGGDGSKLFTFAYELRPDSQLDFYANFVGMAGPAFLGPGTEGAGYFGRSFLSAPIPSYSNPPGTAWRCVEVMVKPNTTPAGTDGEIAAWIDGLLVEHFRPGAPTGSFNAAGDWITGAGSPFPGLQIRDETTYGVNFMKVQNYQSGGTLDVDDLVVSAERVGCGAPAPAAFFEVSPSSFSASSVVGQPSSPTRTLTVTNTGGATGTYSITPRSALAAPFASITNQTATLAPGQSIAVTYAFNASGLTPQTYSLLADLTNPANAANAVLITATYTVTPTSTGASCGSSYEQRACDLMSDADPSTVVTCAEKLDRDTTPYHETGLGGWMNDSLQWTTGPEPRLKALFPNVDTPQACRHPGFNAVWDTGNAKRYRTVTGSSVGLPQVSRLLQVNMEGGPTSVYLYDWFDETFEDRTYCGRAYVQYSAGTKPPKEGCADGGSPCIPDSSPGAAHKGPSWRAIFTTSGPQDNQGTPGAPNVEFTFDNLAPVLNVNGTAQQDQDPALADFRLAPQNSAGNDWWTGSDPLNAPRVAGRAMKLKDCIDSLCRVEMCFDHRQDDRLRARLRITRVDNGEFGQWEEVGDRVSPGIVPRTGWFFGPITVADDANTTAGLYRLYTHLLSAKVPLNESYWLGAACEVEGGCGGQPEPLKVLGFGDEITQGWDYGSLFPAEWARIDRGKPGETAAAGASRFLDAGLASGCADAASTTCSYANTIAQHPDVDVVVVGWGTHDAKLYGASGGSQLCEWDIRTCSTTTGIDSYAESMHDVLQAIEDSGRAAVVLIPPPVYGTHGGVDYVTAVERGSDIRKIAMAEAVEHGFTWADLWGVWQAQVEPWDWYQPSCTAPDAANPPADCVLFAGNVPAMDAASAEVKKAIEDAWRLHTLPIVSPIGSDDAAIEAALGICDGLDGCELRLPAGTYSGLQIDGSRMRATLLPRGLRIRGAGRGATILAYREDGQATHALIHNDATPDYFSIRDLTFDGRRLSAQMSVNCVPQQVSVGLSPKRCAGGNLHTAVSFNSPANALKRRQGIARVDFLDWPNAGLIVENLEQGGFADLVFRRIGCSDRTAFGATQPFVGCHASWGTDPGPNTTTQAGHGMHISRISRTIGVIRVEVEASTKYSIETGNLAGVSVGDVPAFESTQDIFVGWTTHKNTATGFTMRSPRTTFYDFSMTQDLTKPHWWATGIDGGTGLNIFDWVWSGKALNGYVESLGAGLSTRNESQPSRPSEMYLRNVDFARPCLQDVATSGALQLMPTSASPRDIGVLRMEEVRVAVDSNNYCALAADAHRIDQLIVDGFEVDGGSQGADVLVRDTVEAGSIDGCTLLNGAQITNQSPGVAGDCV